MSKTVLSFDCVKCGQQNEERPLDIHTRPTTGAGPLSVPLTTCGWCQYPLMHDASCTIRWDEL